jgi:hypothetical protein
MSAFDDKIAKLTLDKINKYGAVVTFKSVGATVYDPATSKNVPTGGKTQTGLRVVLEDMKGQFFGKNAVVEGDKKFIVAALAIVAKPKPGDAFTTPDGQTFIVAVGDSIKTTFSGSTEVLYEVQART